MHELHHLHRLRNSTVGDFVIFTILKLGSRRKLLNMQMLHVGTCIGKWDKQNIFTVNNIKKLHWRTLGMGILPRSVEFDKGEALGNGLIKVVFCQDQQAWLQRKETPDIKQCCNDCYDQLIPWTFKRKKIKSINYLYITTAGSCSKEALI